MTPILIANQISKVFDVNDQQIHVLRDISLEISQGEFVAIMGPSGSGKSTLLAIMGNLEAATTGQIYLEGLCLNDLNDDASAILRRSRIGFVFQSFNLVPILTAIDNVALPLLLAGHKGREVRARAEAVLQRVGLADRILHKPHELSGGQQQRVAIARALVTQPAIILADEPTGNLDSKSSHSTMQLLRNQWEELGQTTLVVTHDPEVAAWADRLVVLRDGSIVSDQRLHGPLTARPQVIRSVMEGVLADA